METTKPSSKRKPIINFITRLSLCLLVLLVGVVGMARLASLKQPPEEVISSEHSLRVEVLAVQPESVPIVITGYGEVRARDVVTIAPEVAGRIIRVHPRLEVGESIAKGELLFEIDTLNYASAVNETRSSVRQWGHTVERLQKQYALDRKRLKTLERNRDLVRAEFRRLRNLFEKDKVGTRSGVEKAEQNYNSTVDQVDLMARAISLYPLQIKEAQNNRASVRARLDLAAANLERCRVLAPFNGRIKSVLLENGQYVSPGQQVVTLANDAVLEIQMPLDSRDARQWLRFKNGKAQAAAAWFGALEPVDCEIRWTEAKNGHRWRGRMHRVVAFDPKTRTVTVAVRIGAEAARAVAHDGLPLVEGMFCEVRIPGRVLEDVFRLPRQAVGFNQTVYVAEENRLKTRPVMVARVEGEEALIVDGLQSGDRVIATRLVDPLENALLEITN